MSVQAELACNSVQNLIESLVGLFRGEAQELGLATEYVRPRKVLSNQEGCVNVHEIFFIFVVNIAKKVLLNKAPKS